MKFMATPLFIVVAESLSHRWKLNIFVVNVWMQLKQLKLDLNDVLYSHTWTPDAYLLARAYVAGDGEQPSTSISECLPVPAASSRPRVPLCHATKKVWVVATILMLLLLLSSSFLTSEPICYKSYAEYWQIFSARCNIYISRLCYDASVRLSVTEVHWRIRPIANLGFKFRSHFTAHYGCRAAGGRRAACVWIILRHASQC